MTANPANTFTLPQRLRMVDPTDRWESIVERCELAAREIERLMGELAKTAEIDRRVAHDVLLFGTGITMHTRLGRHWVPPEAVSIDREAFLAARGQPETPA